MPKRNFQQLELVLSRRDLDLAIGLLYQWGILSTQTLRKRSGIFLSAELPKAFPFARFRRQIQAWKKTSAGRKIFKSMKRRLIRDRSWIDNYKKHLRPFPLLPAAMGSRRPLIVDPRGKISVPRDPNTLYIEAGLAFGTGTHATTQLAAQLLAETMANASSPTVLDVGCGTGILAMAAKKLGAKRVVAVDNDPEALVVARQNFRRNRIRGVDLRLNLKKLGKKFSIVVSNIGLNVLVELRRELLAALAPGGHIILTGLLYRDREALRRAYPGLKVRRIKNRLGWSAFLMQKPG